MVHVICLPWITVSLTIILYKIKHLLIVYINLRTCHKEIFNPFPHYDTFLTPLGNKPFENTVGKGEIARNDQFLLFPQCFLPVRITVFHFRQI